MRILIVDDEVIIRNGLSTVINWEELGFELLRPAASAEEALSRLDAEQPHIVLTDIRMTGKSGLDLASEARSRLPETEIIILTGYDEFAYAQQALREGVSDYLLKTSRPEEIIRAAIKAKQRILGRWESRKQDHLKLAAFRDALLEKLLAEGGPAEPDEAALAQVPRLLPKLCPAAGGAAAYRALIVAASGWSDASLLLFAVENTLSELLPGETLLRKDHVLAVLASDAASPEADDLEKARLELGRVARKLKCELFAAAGSRADELRGLPRSYGEARHAFGFRWMAGDRALIAYDEVKARRGGKTVCSQEEEARLVSVLKGGSVIELRRWADEAVEAQLADPEATPASLRAYMGSIVLSGRRWLERVSQSLGGGESLQPPEETPVWEADPSEPPGEALFQSLRAFLDLYREAVSGERVSYVKRAIAYIRDHLDSNLTLQQVAKQVHLNPNHFSEVFKRETGLTYIDFVTRERMRRAMEILDESPAKISEVASRVGYEDVKYFGQLFKKATGKTPSEYRAGRGDIGDGDVGEGDAE